ncbi:transcription factor SPT20 homolog [Rousettus aegyptiacus]|uniref:transcription factor SPT20 homolog n=1 Tax=Rousettus aegyptiacus TaxID=9407 RepID=UPI00168D474E|nr:transcription factor SPT20 homolog [Rousettus aegyptiacus]
MQRALEQALDRADYVIESALQRPPKRKYSSSGRKTLYEKLYDIYVEECGKEPEVTEALTSNVNLLEKLVKRESLPCLVVNLYPGREGYSLMLKGKNGYLETIQLSYEEGELLEYLDAEELPPILVDILESAPVNLFHCGCVIAEIRDYRQCSNTEGPRYQSRHILLRPTMQTLAYDVQSITSDNQTWTQDDKLLLESQLILATAEPLCLDPSVSVACTENRLLFNRQKMNTHPMRRNFKRYSTASLNQEQELPHHRSLSPELRVWSSCKRIRESQASQQYDLKITKASCVDMWKQRPCDLAVPSEVDVEKYAKGKRSVKCDDSQPTVWPDLELRDDSVYGYEAGSQSKVTKQIFLQSLNDPFISGKKSCKTSRCLRHMTPHHSSTDDHLRSFLPWLKTDTGRVVSWSEDVAQKNTTKCPVKTSPRPSASASLSRPPGEDTEQPQAVSGQPSALGQGVQHTPAAIKLPLILRKSRLGNSLPPQQASSFRRSPFPALASKPPSLSQKSSMEVNQVSTLRAATPSSASSSLRTPATPVRSSPTGLSVIKVVGPVGVAKTVARGSNPSIARASAPVGVTHSSLPSRGQPPNAQPVAPQASSQAGVQLVLKPAANLMPLTLVQLPPGSLILNTQQQQQQWLYQLIPQQQFQQPTTFHLQQPVSQVLNAQVMTSQTMVLPAQQPVLINVNGVGNFLQPQATVLSQLGSAQIRPVQSLPQQGILLSPVFQQQQQPQPQPQQIQWRILQQPMAVATVAAQTTQLQQQQQQQQQRGQQTASKPKGKINRGPPTIPKS